MTLAFELYVAPLHAAALAPYITHVAPHCYTFCRSRLFITLTLIYTYTATIAAIIIAIANAPFPGTGIL